MNPYNAAYNGAVLVDLSSRGIIALTGRDRVDLINRMSTNKLTDLTSGEGAATVLTTPIGRIIDVLTFLYDDEQAILVSGDGRGERILNYLRRNIFFNDQVQITALNQTHRLYGLYGVKASVLLDFVDAANLLDYHFVKHDGVYIVRAEPLAGSGFWLLGEQEKVKNLRNRLLDEDVASADQQTYNLLCIEAGIPLTETEITEDYIPLEAGLWHAVSFNKGCYTGQEVIARMESRGKLAKMLVRLAMDNPLELDTPLYEDGKKVGVLTSTAPHPAGGFLGLGFVKPAAVSEKSVLTSEDGTTLKILGIAGTQPGR